MLVRLVVLAIAFVVLPAVSATTVSEALKVFDGSRFTGRITIDGPAMTTADGRSIGRWRSTYTVTASSPFIVVLEPNDTARPANTAYVVRYYPSKGNSWQETWFVPTSASVLKLADVKLTATLAAGLALQPHQIGSGGAITGQCLIWDGTRWKPGDCGSGAGASVFSQTFTANAYSAGTVGVTNGSATVIGTDTAWNETMVGWYFCTRGGGYLIGAVPSATELVLIDPYDEYTEASGAPYFLAQPVTVGGATHGRGDKPSVQIYRDSGTGTHVTADDAYTLWVIPGAGDVKFLFHQPTSGIVVIR